MAVAMKDTIRAVVPGPRAAAPTNIPSMDGAEWPEGYRLPHLAAFFIRTIQIGAQPVTASVCRQRLVVEDLDKSLEGQENHRSHWSFSSGIC